MIKFDDEMEASKEELAEYQRLYGDKKRAPSYDQQIKDVETRSKQPPVEPPTASEVEDEGDEVDNNVDYAPLEGVAKWTEENIFIPIADMMDGERDAEEVAVDRASAREDRADLDQQIQDNPTFLGETGVAVVGGVAGAIETVGETAELIGDTVMAIDGVPDPKNTPWDENYEWADWDLGTAENQTAVGKFARTTISILVGIKGLKAVGVGVGSATRTQRIASEAIRGGLVDFFMDPGEDNLSNLVQSGPLANVLSQALAHQDDDNQWIRRLKNMVEGGTIGIAVDGVTELYGALRAGMKSRAAAKAKGLSDAQASEQAAKSTEEFVAKINKYSYGKQGELDLGTSPKQMTVEDGGLDLKYNKQGELDFDRPDLDPGSATRKLENTEVSGRPAKDALVDGDVSTPSKPSLVDPQERVTQTRKFSTTDSASSFWEGPLGSGKSLVAESDISRLKDISELSEFIQERIPEINVQEMVQRLRKQPREHIEDTFRSLAAFADSANPATLEGLQFKNTFDFKGVDAGGAVVLDTLVNSVSERISFLAQEIQQLTKLDAPFQKQANSILNRAEALITMRKQATQFASHNLQNWKLLPPALRRNFEVDEKNIKTMFEEIRSSITSDDPLELMEAKQNIAKLSVALTHAKGDPNAVTNIMYAAAKMGLKRMDSVFINSLLSSPLTHSRNIGGNVIAMGERTSSRTIGNLMTGDIKGARLGMHAFDGIWDSFTEALAVGRASFDSPYAITTPGSKIIDHVLHDRQTIDQLQRVAVSKADKAATNIVSTAFDLTNNAWFNWPGKALQAGDDFTKSMLARMELRYQAGVEADRIAGDGASFKTREQTYLDLKNKKLAANGEILDHDLVTITENAAFQRELEGWVAGMAQGIQNIPGGRIILPFFKTGHNITRYAAQLTPLAPLSSEFRQVMKYGTADEKAIMRGRMALGSTLGAGAAGLAYNGFMTGYGPPPGPERDLWLSKNQPMSIWVGNMQPGSKGGKWVSYKAIPGFSIVFSTISDLTMIGDKLTDGDAAYLVGAIPFFIANAITSQAMFQGVLNLSELLDVRQWGNQEKMIDAIGGFANNLGGGSSMRRHMENVLSDSMHEYQHWYQEVLSKMTGGLSSVALEALGLESGKVMQMDILTGKDKPTVYSNKINSVNPFTVIGKDVSDLVSDLAQFEYPINLAVPRKVSGVQLNPAEKRLYSEAMYDKGQFAESLAKTLRSPRFRKLYIDWIEQKKIGDAVVKEKSGWYELLDSVVQSGKKRGRQALVRDDNPVSKNYILTFPDRSRRASTGSSGSGVTQEDLNRIGAIKDIKSYTGTN